MRGPSLLANLNNIVQFTTVHKHMAHASRTRLRDYLRSLLRLQKLHVMSLRQQLLLLSAPFYSTVAVLRGGLLSPSSSNIIAEVDLIIMKGKEGN